MLLAEGVGSRASACETFDVMADETARAQEKEKKLEENPLPGGVALLGLAMALAAGLPLTPEGAPFVRLVLGEFSRGVLEGIMMIAGFGSPFVFGLLLFVGHLFFSPAAAKRMVSVPVSLLHSQLLLVAFVLWRHGESVAAPALLGVAVVGSIHLVVHTAKAHGTGDGPSLVWYARWGATMIAAVAAWSRLQWLADVRLGIAVDVLLACALLIVFIIVRKQRVLRTLVRQRAAGEAEAEAEPES
jgi:hypothetical protein